MTPLLPWGILLLRAVLEYVRVQTTPACLAEARQVATALCQVQHGANACRSVQWTATLPGDREHDVPRTTYSFRVVGEPAVPEVYQVLADGLPDHDHCGGAIRVIVSGSAGQKGPRRNCGDLVERAAIAFFLHLEGFRSADAPGRPTADPRTSRALTADEHSRCPDGTQFVPVQVSQGESAMEADVILDANRCRVLEVTCGSCD